tara:strand:+ start:233 stop:751 length:519 start_codon:yes stop_codon:yes gene_type:complete
MVKLDEATWALIKTRYIAGESADSLAAEYGIKPETIHMRSTRQKWQTPKRMRLQVLAEQERDEIVRTVISNPAKFAKLWKQKDVRMRLDLLEKLKEVVVNPESINIRSANDVEKLVNSIVKLNNLTEGGYSEAQPTTVNVNHFSAIKPAKANPVVDVDSEDVGTASSDQGSD